MKKIALPTLASFALIGLSACGEPADPVVEDDTMMTEPAMTDPAMTEPVVPAPGQAEEGDSLMIDESGMDATITDGETTTTMDLDENPSMSVEGN